MILEYFAMVMVH